MDNLFSQVIRLIQIAFIILSLNCFLWFLYPMNKAVYGGFIFGVIGGLFMQVHLAWRLTRISDRIVTGGRPGFGFGFLSRAGIAGCAGLISIKVLNFSAAATLSGLLVLPFALLIMSLFAAYRNQKANF